MEELSTKLAAVTGNMAVIDQRSQKAAQQRTQALYSQLITSRASLMANKFMNHIVIQNLNVQIGSIETELGLPSSVAEFQMEDQLSSSDSD